MNQIFVKPVKRNTVLQNGINLLENNLPIRQIE